MGGGFSKAIAAVDLNEGVASGPHWWHPGAQPRVERGL